MMAWIDRSQFVPACPAASPLHFNLAGAEVDLRHAAQSIRRFKL